MLILLCFMLHRSGSSVDALSAALTQAKLHSVLPGAFAANGPWAVALPRHRGLKLHVVLRGTCWMKHAKSQRRLQQGDSVLTTGTDELIIASELPATNVMPLDKLLPMAHERAARHGPAADFFAISTFFELDGHLPALLFERLPPVIYVAETSEEAAVLRWGVEQLRLEFANDHPGRSLVLEYLTPVLLVQVLRAHLHSEPAADNWLGALADPQLRPAIEAMHLRFAEPWTLEALAHLSGLSRSSFAGRFRRKIGHSPMRYLARTRIQVACDLLREGELNVGGVAVAVGYGSESAFSSAFTKIVGCRPGAYARNAD